MTAAIVWGLLSAILFGATDFVARFANQAAGVTRTMFYGHCASMVSLGAWLVWQRPAFHSSFVGWCSLLGSDAALVAATACLYRALSVGRLGLVAPITSCYGAIGAVLSVAAGEAVTGGVLAGLALVALGAVMAAVPAGDGTAGRRGGILATLAALLYGFGFWFQGQYAVPDFGALPCAWSYYAFSVSCVLLVALARQTRLPFPSRAEAPTVFGGAALAAGGYVAALLGEATGRIAVVTVLCSLASAVTVLLAWLVLKERIARVAWLGLGAVVGGLALLRA